ncbi:MAG TPA: FAD-binding oxidoreductase [Thermoplasmata archaeon]|nr:FAD-binding oxidoreductase [Thermoplasmata archaeon]
MNTPARSGYRTVIVGAGIVGLFTAYHLARAGAGPILVLDRGFLSSGASGRNGGGVRQQWETPETLRLAREAVAAYRRFGSEFGYNIWFRQGGYLFLAMDASEQAQLERVRSTVAHEGLPIRSVTPAEIAGHVPGIDTAGLVGGSYLGSDGTLYPFPAIWGLYEAVRGLGVEVRLQTSVTGFARTDGRVTGVVTSAGTFEASTVVNAAGGWSGDLSRLAGLEVANVATRHEILATEPLKPFLDPMVVRLRDGLYFSQTMRGEIVGGLTVAHPTGTAAGMGSSTEFLRTMARALTTLLPRLRPLGVLRAWSGYYDDTPDGLPVIGEDPRLPGFVHANGFGGHGFMLAPAATRRVAQAVLGERSDLDPTRFGVARFFGPGTNGSAERIQLG